MILALDVGNTHIVAGIFRGTDLLHHWRISTDVQKTEDELGFVFMSIMDYAGINKEGFTGGIIASVVPPLTPVLEKMMGKYFKIAPIIVGPGTKTGINLKFENPREVGPDRIANTAAAYVKYGGPAIVVDFGTATTFDVISKEGDYIGGVIAPGILTAADSLFQKAARLPRIEILPPKRAIGKNTVESMQSGILYGFAGQTDAIVKRICREMGEECKVIATGGHARMVAGESCTITTVDQFLTLEGLNLIYNKKLWRIT